MPTTAIPPRAFGEAGPQFDLSDPDHPACHACSNCQANDRLGEEVAWQRANGPGIEVLGRAEKPCLRWLEHLRQAERVAAAKA